MDYNKTYNIVGNLPFQERILYLMLFHFLYLSVSVKIYKNIVIYYKMYLFITWYILRFFLLKWKQLKSKNNN